MVPITVWADRLVRDGMVIQHGQSNWKPYPPGAFRVVAIASNGNSFADFPVPSEFCVDQG